MKHHKGMYYITVIEDVASGQVIGSGTLFIEQKFIHNCALVRTKFYVSFFPF